MDPYEILGLNFPSTKEEIKIRYYELAKKHHPDKLIHLSLEERQVHEELFKKINVAYKLLTEKDLNDTSQNEWKGMWSYMDNFMSDPTMLKNMGDLLKNMVNVAREYKKQKGSEHHIKVEVSLEEIHNRKEKKLRLFLKNRSDPVFINVDCGNYPDFLYTHITPSEQTLFIHIEFILKQHDVYTLDDLFDTNDLISEIPITFYEYLIGCEKRMLYLDGKELIITIPKWDLNSIIIKNKGLNEKGNLRIIPKIIFPTDIDFLSLDLKDFEKLVKICKKLGEPKQNDAKSI